MPELSPPTATIRTVEQTEQRWFYGGAVHRWLATAADTGGTFLLFDDVMEQGKRTPLHTHPTDESLYVGEGEILVHLAVHEHLVAAAGRRSRASCWSAFLVLSETATLLTLHTPGTCADFYLGRASR